LEKTE